MENRMLDKKVYNRKVDYRRNFSAISLIVLAVILAVQLIFFLTEIVLSFKSYNPAAGISGSSWVGFQNFSKILISSNFRSVIQNTISFNLLFAVMVFVIAFIAGRIITAIPQDNILRDMLAILCILPLFLPAEVYANWFITAMGSRTFINPDAMRFLHPLLSALKYMGIPIITINILDGLYEEKDSMIPVKVSGLFALITLAFIMNSCFSLTKSIYNPLNYSTTDMADTFIFRAGMQEMNLGVSSAVGIVQTVTSLLSFAVMFMPIKLLYSTTFKKAGVNKKTENITQKLISSIIALVVFSVIYFLPYILNRQPFLDISNMKVSTADPVLYYLMLSLVSAFICAVLAGITSWSFISLNKKIVFSAVILLSAITIIAAKPISISRYIMIRNMGLLNTGFAIILTTCFSAAAAWAVACILRTEESVSTRSYLLALLGVFLIQAAVIYINSTPPSTYFYNANLWPILVLKQISSAMPNMLNLSQRISLNNTAGLYGFIVSLPSLIIFLIVEITFPRKYLLSVISGGMKS